MRNVYVYESTHNGVGGLAIQLVACVIHLNTRHAQPLKGVNLVPRLINLVAGLIHTC